MAFTAVAFTAQSMPELVQDFDQSHSHAQVDPVVGSKKLLKGRQFAAEILEIHEYQDQCADSKKGDTNQGWDGEDPPCERVQRVENAFRIDASKSQSEDVG